MIHVHLSIFMCPYTVHVHICMFMCPYIHVHILVHILVHIHVHVSIFMFICPYTSYVSIYLFICSTCVYMVPYASHTISLLYNYLNSALGSSPSTPPQTLNPPLAILPIITFISIHTFYRTHAHHLLHIIPTNHLAYIFISCTLIGRFPPQISSRRHWPSPIRDISRRRRIPNKPSVGCRRICICKATWVCDCVT